MDLEALLHAYGYPLLFAGVFAEGESLLVLAGYFASRGYLELYGVITTAFVAAVCGDQFFFHLGRRRGKTLLARFPKLAERVNGALRRVERNQAKLVLSIRFLWGLRIALPIALGLTTMSARRYFLLDLASAAIWSTAVSLAGFAAGGLISRYLGDVHRYELWIVMGLLGLALVALGIRSVLAKNHKSSKLQ
jgi:membrane protein DedA with SNARE-associated domain